MRAAAPVPTLTTEVTGIGLLYCAGRRHIGIVRRWRRWKSHASCPFPDSYPPAPDRAIYGWGGRLRAYRDWVGAAEQWRG
jgi:hypothetical protein